MKKTVSDNKIFRIQDGELKDLLTYLDSVLGYSEKTSLSYGEDISDYLFFLQNRNISKSQINKNQIREYLLSLNIKGLKPTSVKRYISSIRHFYKYLCQYKGYQNNPFDTILSPKKEKNLPQFLSQEEINSFFDANCQRTDKLVYRDQAILELMFASGLRCSEVVSLKTEMISFESQTMKIIGKGDKERIVPFSKTAQKSLLDYLHLSRHSLIKPNQTDCGFFFLNCRGNQLTERGLEKIISSCQEKSGFELKVHPDMLRHSCATSLLNNGADIKTIQEILGHQSIATTSIYTHLTYEDLKKTYESCFPKATSDYRRKNMKPVYVIFDFNGTMFFDEDKHIVSWKKFALDAFGYELKDEEFPLHIHGHNNSEILSYLAKKEFTPQEVLSYATAKELYYQRLCLEDKENLHLVNGLPEFLDLLKSKNIPLAIATASMKPNVDWYIKTFNLHRWFKDENIIYDNGLLTRGKPDPMIYLWAMEALQAKPENTIVFEDAISGIKSAYRAGAGKVVAIEKEERRSQFEKMKEVSLVINDFTVLPQAVKDFLEIK